MRSTWAIAMRAGVLCRGGEIRSGLETPEEVRLLEDHRGGVRRRRGELVGIDRAAAMRNLDDLEAEAARVRLDDLTHLGVQRLREDDLGAVARVLRDEARVGGDRAAVVSGRVRHVHAGQLADDGLVLEDRLQHALAHLRLIRRVRRQELAAREQRRRRPPGRSGRRCPRRGTTARLRCGRFASASSVRCRTSSSSGSAGGTSSSRSKRTPGGICSNSSSIDETPIAASISARSASVRLR